MKKAQIIIIAALVAVAVLLVGNYLLDRSLRTADYGKLARLLKAAVGEAVTTTAVSPAKIEKGVEAPTSIGTPPGPSNVTPEQIKRGAQLLDTYANALQAGVAAISIRAGTPLPETSSGLVALAPRYRLDAWGRPFCFVRLEGRVAVISAGPGKGAYAGCKDMGIDPRDISRLSPRRLYEYPSGKLVVVVDRP